VIDRHVVAWPVVVCLALIGLLSACGDDQTTATSTSETATTATTTTTTSATTTTTLAPARYDVVLVAADDVLNVRSRPGVSSPQITELAPNHEGVMGTGRTEEVDGTTWIEVETADGLGWVNGTYLTPEVTTADFAAAEDDLRLLLDQLAAVIDSRGDLRPVTSERGLLVAHHDPVRRFTPLELASLLTDPTAVAWGNPGCGPDGCGQLQTFKAAVADRFRSTYVDPDVEIAVDELIPGPGGTLAENVVPFELTNFHYLAVNDRGDEPAYDGLDWMTWNVYFEKAPGGWKIAGLSVDEWGP
jgi:hypothetical protein